MAQGVSGGTTLENDAEEFLWKEVAMTVFEQARQMILSMRHLEWMEPVLELVLVLVWAESTAVAAVHLQ